MKQLIEILEKFNPGCEQEVCDKKLFLECAKTMPDCLTRQNKLCHFTASAFVLNEKHDKLVCIYHNLYNSWGWLGGHADGDENLLHVAKKEIEEESGISDLKLLDNNIFSIEALSVNSHFKKGAYVNAHVHLNVTYVFTTSEKNAIRILEEENSDIAWLTPSELMQKSTEELMKPIYKKIIEKLKKYPV